MLPEASEALDWEAELALMIGARVRHADEDEAVAAIAGFTVCIDVTTRDWRYRTKQWLQGKTFEATTPLGPALVTPENSPAEAVQKSRSVPSSAARRCRRPTPPSWSSNPVTFVRYVSTILTLQPGDVVATDTPSRPTTRGVGHARKPPRYLIEGDMLVTETLVTDK